VITVENNNEGDDGMVNEIEAVILRCWERG
jgi:hypothetical protein